MSTLWEVWHLCVLAGHFTLQTEGYFCLITTGGGAKAAILDDKSSLASYDL